MIIHQAEIQPIDFEGLKIYDYTGHLSASSSLALIDVPSGGRHRSAKSDRSDKYYFVIQGRLVFTLDDVTCELGAGDFCWVPRGHVFSYTNAEAEPARLILLHTPTFDLQTERFLE